MYPLTASIVIPCHNAAETVERAVRSALGQTRPPAEVICVDDGSADGTLDVLRALAREAPGRLTVVPQTNAGACAARNRGLDLVTAPYVQFLDDDDWLHHDKLAHQLALVESLGGVEGGPSIVAGSFTRVRLDGDCALHVSHPENPWAALAWVHLGITSANLFRRAAVERAGRWDERRSSSQEYELMFRMLRQGATVVFDPDPLTVLYQRATSITLATPEANVVERIALGAAIRDHVRRHGSAEAARAADEALFFLVQMRCAYSIERGTASYREHFAPGHVPRDSSSVGRAYRWLHQVVGFEFAQRARIVGRRVKGWVRASSAGLAPPRSALPASPSLS